MIQVSDLPALNATLNGLSAVFLSIGFRFIRLGRMRQHRACMIAAFVTSSLFLISYVVYHANIGSRPFPGHGMLRPVYFSILITHVLLAVLVLPLSIVTLNRGLRSRFDAHARLARWTLPIWLYVSVTGVIVYVMLYQLY